ncbi:hypothetical protein K0M31_014028 [Melipona bicolor]|uniref:Uncharacterized protein n=1 Tax=Melipona bicolor TaxID=60889 RepID=A0AA40KU05_9HYME|nr:hypothetical protein K0M31_014028 [Melipona bicolor]
MNTIEILSVLQGVKKCKLAGAIASTLLSVGYLYTLCGQLITLDARGLLKKNFQKTKKKKKKKETGEKKTKEFAIIQLSTWTHVHVKTTWKSMYIWRKRMATTE